MGKRKSIVARIKPDELKLLKSIRFFEIDCEKIRVEACNNHQKYFKPPLTCTPDNCHKCANCEFCDSNLEKE